MCEDSDFCKGGIEGNKSSLSVFYGSFARVPSMRALPVWYNVL